MNKYLLSLLCISVGLTACGLKSPKPNSHPKPASHVGSMHSAAVSQTKAPQPAHQHVNVDSLSPSFLYLAAQDAMKEGKRAMALELLTALVKKDPAAVEPQIELTELLLESGQAAQAQQYLGLLLASPALSAAQRKQIQLLQARLYLAARQAEKALASINDFLKKHPVHIQARDFQARVFDAEKRYDEGLVALAQAIRISDLPEFRLLQAQLFLKKEDASAARASLKRMQTLAPNDDAPILMLSALAMQQHKHDAAEKILRDFLAHHSESIRVNLALGKLLVQDKRLVEAILLYRRMAVRTGNNAEVLQQLGRLYFEHKDYAQAESTFRQLIASHPSEMGYFYLAASLESLQREPESVTWYEKIQTTPSLKIAAALRLTAINLHHNALDQALSRLKDILKQQPRNLEAHLMRSSVRLAQGKYRLLLDETEAVTGINKLPSQLLFNRAVAFEHFKQYDQVENTLNRLLKHAPDYSEALNFLGYTYAVQGINLAKAEALIQLALIKKPNDGYYLDSLAWAQYKNGEFSKAEHTQAKALKQVADDAVMHEHYGDILWAGGHQEKARQAWQQAIDLKSEHPKALKKKIKSGL